MAVFRVERNTGYTVMSNHHLRNKELTLKAKGLLSQMLSLPEDWDYTLAEPTEQEIRQMRKEIEEAQKEKSRAYHRQYSREYRARNLEKQREYDRMKAREYRARRKAQAAAPTIHSLFGRFLFENPHFPQVKSREKHPKNAPIA